MMSTIFYFSRVALFKVISPSRNTTMYSKMVLDINTTFFLNAMKWVLCLNSEETNRQY